MNELALCAGAGGGIYGSLLCGHRVVCAVEHNKHCQRVLIQRQREGIFPPFPVWDKLETFDGRPWRGLVDLVSAGWPCQDISIAGKGAGLDGKKSGLWRHVARVIREVEPEFVFLENSPHIVSRGLDRVLWDLAAMGFAAEWGMFTASAVGALHQRKRWFLVAYATGERRAAVPIHPVNGHWPVERDGWQPDSSDLSQRTRDAWRLCEPRLVGLADDVADRCQRIAAAGNGQVPGVVVRAWRELGSRLAN